MATALFRAVSLAELEDFRLSDRLRVGPCSCEGKHFACTANAARRWGEALYGESGFAILRVTLSDELLAELFAWDVLDGIGPARFATIEQLERLVAVEVIDEPGR